MEQLSTTDYLPKLSEESDEHGKLFVISKDGTTTFGRVVYNRHATEKQSAETVEASLSGESDGTTPSTSMHASIQHNNLSEGKDSKLTDTLQEKQQKSCKD